MLSLRVKLTLALLVTGLSGVVIVTVLVQRFTTSAFDDFIVEQQQANFIADMAAYYEVYGSWDNMSLVRGRLPIPPPSRTSGEEKPPEQPPASVRSMLIDQDGRVIFPGPGYTPGQQLSAAQLERAEPILVDGEPVGYALAESDWPGRDALEEAYIDRIDQLLRVAMAGAVALALLLSVLFARSLSKPLREIATAMQSIARGNLEQQVRVRSRDEIGQVAAAFNQMSANLSRAHQLRRQMTADIAHELRTPLSVVVGYLESMREGLLQPTPERFNAMHDEAQHLQRLVEDLRLLSLADAAELPLNWQSVNVGDVVQQAAVTFAHAVEQQRISLAVEVQPALPPLRADPDRLLQVLSNLLSNALRHTPEQGKITLSARADTGQVVIEVHDTGSGIAPEHLPYIFERFYRADSARHQEQAESGLGLAIAKSLVEAHGGRISAASEVGCGTTILMAFPLPDRPASAT